MEFLGKRYLFTPGPVPVSPKVLLTQAQPMTHHRLPEFSEILKEIRENLKYLFQTQEKVYFFTSSGTGAMEAAIVNLFSPGDKVIVVEAGKFGQRWKELTLEYGLNPIVISLEWGRVVKPEQIEEAIRKNPEAKAILIQACETSTGAKHPIQEIAQITSQRETLLIIDAITALGVFPLPMDEWGLDGVITGSQKALSLPPGLSFIALSKKAQEASLRAKLPRYYFDLRKEEKAYEKDTTAFTPAVSLLLGLREILKLLYKSFPLRRCSLAEMKRRKKPCIYFQIQKCLAPCVEKISKEEYAKYVDGIIEFFQGKGKELVKKIKKEIDNSAENLEFEKAAFLRDRLKDLEELLEKQAVVLNEPIDLDLWEIRSEKERDYLIVLFVRYGYLYGYQTFQVNKSIEETLPQALFQFYLEGKIIPEKIFVPQDLEERKDYEKILSEIALKEIEIIPIPEKIEFINLRKIALKNLENFILSEKRQEKPWYGGLREEIKKILKIDKDITSIEAIDLSQYYGKAKVGSVVAFFEGEPDKSRYRHYHIKGERKDDLSMLYEVVYRRLKRGLEEGTLPDLLLIDGGKAHLETALKAAEDLGIDSVALRSIAKNEKREPEKIYLPLRKNPIYLPKYKEVFAFIGRIMNEAHRFAQSFAEKALQKETLKSKLEKIPGIGPKRKEILLKTFKNFEDIKKAPLHKLSTLPSFNLKIAKNLKEYLEKDSS